MNQFFKSFLAFAIVGLSFFSSFSAQGQDVKKEAKASAGSGGAKAALCIGCHSIEGYNASYPEVHKVPKIAGQNAKYIAQALTAYKKGERKHPTMRGIAAALSDQDIADLSTFYSGNGAIDGQIVPAQVSVVPSAAVDALLKKGGCTGCHGGNFASPVDASYPKIAGQHSDYLYVALKAYKTEKNQYIGRNNPIMSGIAKPFSNSEMRLMAEYLGSLNGDLKTSPQSRFK
jgi:cytochrome c553